jgi:aryl-phospho-beta-D-glucosidase BglC (GH1 family)
MKRFLNKAKEAFSDDHKVHAHGGNPQQPIGELPDRPSTIQPPTPADVDRYRYHHGTNIGSVFAIERWLTGSRFPDGSEGSSEKAAADAWVAREGVDATRDRFEKAWREYVSDQDLDWLRDVAKCTSVRLPIGYWDLGPQFCKGTAFDKLAGVYQNAWHYIQELVARCSARGIAVLIDVHGLPGGANSQEHSGTNSGKTEFWKSKSNRELATKCMCFIAEQARSMAGVLGIQIVNEAEHDAPNMYEWYEQVLTEVSRIDACMPIYISDGWNLGRCVDWSLGPNNLSHQAVNPVVIDTHYYWAFTDEDKQKTPQQITDEAHGKLGELDGKDGSVVDRGAVQAIVGEYSCVLTEDSWAKGGDTSKDDLVRAFGNAQSDRYQSRSGGSFFWTYRMDWMDGGEWGFKQMTNAHAVKPPFSLTLSKDDVHGRIQHAQSQQNQKRSDAYAQHSHYWDTNHPGNYEHWRFQAGWDVGFTDAQHFFGMRAQKGFEGGDKIGMLELWVLKRIRESGQGGKFVWEYEQGLRQGVKDFYQLAGI